jgi:hypothetical protein
MPAKTTREIIMSMLIRSALVALVLAGASSAMAAPDYNFRDTTKPYGGYNPNSPEGNRAFWDYQGQHGN